jgi:hypothetical protein
VTTASVSVPAPHRGPSSPARPRVGASHPASTAPVLAPKTTQF